MSFYNAVSNHNDRNLVFVNYASAVAANPNAHPLFHTNRGSTYTSIKFCAKLAEQGMVHSMSRAGRCIDNGPMERFFGILKTEMFYLNSFHSEQGLRTAIDKYIDFYNNGRFQENLNGMTPIQFRNQPLAA